MNLPTRAFRLIREEGFAASARRFASYLPRNVDEIPWILRDIYQVRLRPLLPGIGHPVCNGVVVARPRKLLDPLVPRYWIPGDVYEDVPLYEHTLVSALRAGVREKDRVVIIGGGYGVTAVTAARAVGRQGSVVCFEAAADRVADVRNALALNGVETPVRVEHAIVARAISLFGDSMNAPVVSPAELPDCDVLEMDCEGAELDILAGLRIRPRLILVETHGIFGAPTAEVRRLLEGLSYTVEDAGVAEVVPPYKEFCLENDVRVLIARAGGRPRVAPSRRRAS